MAQPGRNLVSSKTRIIVSSSAPGSSKRALLDPTSEEPWTSTSLPSTIHLIFPTPISGATHLALTFQGGFVGTTAMIYVATRPRGTERDDVSLGLMMAGRIYPEDKNKRQIFRIPYPPSVDSGSSQNGPGVHIVTEIPAKPNGGGARAAALVNGNGIASNGTSDAESDVPDITELKIEFEASSDQYGRVTVYGVEVLA